MIILNRPDNLILLLVCSRGKGEAALYAQVVISNGQCSLNISVDELLNMSHIGVTFCMKKGYICIAQEENVKLAFMLRWSDGKVESGSRPANYLF